jgi:hypothetical protein
MKFPFRLETPWRTQAQIYFGYGDEIEAGISILREQFCDTNLGLEANFGAIRKTNVADFCFISNSQIPDISGGGVENLLLDPPETIDGQPTGPDGRGVVNAGERTLLYCAAPGNWIGFAAWEALAPGGP